WGLTCAVDNPEDNLPCPSALTCAEGSPQVACSQAAASAAIHQDAAAGRRWVELEAADWGQGS
ncbi:MAG: hypothetical protein ACK56I_00825, partial [bacterium]